MLRKPAPVLGTYGAGPNSNALGFSRNYVTKLGPRALPANASMTSVCRGQMGALYGRPGDAVAECTPQRHGLRVTLMQRIAGSMPANAVASVHGVPGGRLSLTTPPCM